MTIELNTGGTFYLKFLPLHDPVKLKPCNLNQNKFLSALKICWNNNYLNEDIINFITKKYKLQFKKCL